MARAAMLQGSIKLKLHQKDAGEELWLEALNVYEELGTPASPISIHNRLGEFYREGGQFKESIGHLTVLWICQ